MNLSPDPDPNPNPNPKPNLTLTLTRALVAAVVENYPTEEGNVDWKATHAALRSVP